METNTPLKQEDNLEVKKLLLKLFSYWYVYVIFFILAIVSVKLYLRYTQTIYTAYSTVLIRDAKSKSNADVLLEELSLFNSSKNIANEIGIITSYNMIANALEGLNFDISYYEEGRIKKHEMYKNCPFSIDIVYFEDQHLDKEIHLEYNNNYLFLVNHLKNTEKQRKKIIFDDTTTLQNGIKFICRRVPEHSFREYNTYSFRLNNINTLIKQRVYKLRVSLIDKESTILKLQSSGPILQKEIDFLNALCYQYVQSDLIEKNNIAQNTILFIDKQLKEVTESLQGAESQLKNFRKSNMLMDLSLSATNLYQKIEELNKQKADLLVKDKYYHYLLEYIEKNNNLNNLVAPSTMGIDDPLLINLIADLNKLFLEKSALEFSVSEKNPSINTVNRKINSQKAALVENVKNIIASSDISINELDKRLLEATATFQNCRIMNVN